MRRIKLKSSVVIKGFPNVQVGQVVEVPDGEAQVLLGMGAAELVGPEEKADGLTTGRGVIDTREPAVQTREPEIEPDPGTPPQKSSRRKPAT